MTNATITMPFDEFERMRDYELYQLYWQGRYDQLYSVVRKYAKRDDEGVWRVGEHDVVSLAGDLEEYMNNYETESI